MIKTILVAVVAGAFLMSGPARAEDKAPAAGDSAEKAPKEKKAKKDKKDEGKKDDKAAGAGW